MTALRLGKPEGMKQPSPAALHEAAHAVVAYTLWHQVKAMSVIRPRNGKALRGRTLIGKHSRTRKACPVSMLIILMAGSEAEIQWQGLGHDLLSRGEQPMAFMERTSPLGMKYLLPITQRLVRENKGAIYKLAHALDHHGALTGHQVRGLLK